MDEQEQDELERAIAKALSEGDMATAVQMGIEGYGPEILGYLARSMSSLDDAEEVFCQTCEKIWRGIGDFRADSRFRSWAYRVAVNARSDFWKDAYRRRAVALESGHLHDLIESVRMSTAKHLRSEEKDRFRELREQMTPRECDLMILRLDRGMSWPEVASILDSESIELSSDALRRRAAALRQEFKRAKDKLRGLAVAAGLIRPES